MILSPKSPRLAIIAWLTLCVSQVVFSAETVYLDPADFLEQALPGCDKKALWLDKETKRRIEKLLERPFPGARVRYCQKDGKTGWILDGIGKTEPITSGIVVHEGRVEQVRVLVFRESRGAEVHRQAFVDQFDDTTLVEDHRLDRRIDGITGATLSVWALKRQVRLALFLDGLTREADRDS